MELPLSEVFADAGYWIALINPREADRHLKALELSTEITSKHIQVVTTDMVLTEFLNFFSKFGPLFRSQASQVVIRLQQQSDVTIIGQTGEQFQAGLGLYAQYKDKGWGHTDCVSFSVMWQRGMTHALAFDTHFRQAGFIALLNED